MAKSRARFLSELLGTTGLVKKSKSALAGADEIIDLSTLPSIPNSKLTNSSITINSSATSLGGSVTLTTANVAENTNLYYTDARADARIAAADTGDLSEGSNLYYTNARADARVNLQTGSNLDLSSKDTGDLSEGSNLYYTNARADARIAAASTSDLSEGTNLYYTDARADARVALIVDSAPGTLNTLNELAAALGDDANFSTTVTNSIATKLPLAGGTITGTVVFNSAPTFNTAITMGSSLNVASSVGIAGTTVIDSNRNLTNIGTMSSGDITITGDFPRLYFVDTAGSDLDAYIVNNANGLFFGKTNTPSASNDILALNLSNKSATFSGTISSGAISSTGTIEQYDTYNDASKFLGNKLVADAGSTSFTHPYLDMRRWTGVSGNHYVASIELSPTNADAGSIVFYSDTKSSNTKATTERMRIDSSGNLLVGKTSLDFGATSGQEFRADGRVFIGHSGAGHFVNRIGSDGSISEFRKDGSSVGSIGTTGGDLLIGTDDCAIRFSDGGDQIRVCTTAGTNRDGAIDLGYTDSRFKDLYLSGNTQMGGNLDVVGQIGAYNNPSSSWGQMILRATDFVFKNAGGSIRASLDTSGNFLVGTTNTIPGAGNTAAGISLYNDGRIFASKSGNTTLSLNRNTNNGNIAEFSKDGTTVGSISVNSGYLGVGAGAVYLGYYTSGSTKSIIPMGNATGGAAVGAIDLGLTSANHKFKDLYLSSTAYAPLVVANDIKATGSGGISFQTDEGTKRLEISDAGEVGIGLGAYADPRLKIKSAAGGDPAIHFDGSAANRGAQIKFLDNGSLAGGFIDYHHNGDKMKFGAGSSATPTMTVGDQVVGIGTDSPDALLHVAGTALVENAKLKAIAESNTDTAVDVFVYDTRKDSDGGAWRKRTQNTSWYNETLNTSTRGARKEFPSVAVIVATGSSGNKVTIYDGDDPELPMWMKFTLLNQDQVSISAMNGTVCLGNRYVANAGYGGNGLVLFEFAADRSRHALSNGTVPSYDPERFGVISGNQADTTIWPKTSANGARFYDIVNTSVLDVAMTVLPNAPFDPATGLPIPTIAIGTLGGISAIKDNGSVVDITTTTIQHETPVHVKFVGDRILWLGQNNYDSGWGSAFTAKIPNGDVQVNYNTGANSFSKYSSLEWSTHLTNGSAISIPIAMNSPRTSSFIEAGTNDELILGGKGADDHGTVVKVVENLSNPESGMIAQIASDFATGYQVGDIKLATLSDTDTTNAVGTELVTNGTTFSNTTGWSGNSATVSVSGGELVITGTGTFAQNQSANFTAISGLTPGDQLIVSFDITEFTAVQSSAGIIVGGATIRKNNNLGYWYPNSIGTHTTVVDVTSTGFTLYLHAGTGVGVITKFDNVSVRLAEADRSWNGNGLQVFGTVTKTAVATGADLVGYSNFSSSNYLKQPYNADLNFGTGDFSVSVWAQHTTNGSTAAFYIFDKADSNGTNRFAVYYIPNANRLDLYSPTSGQHVVANGTFPSISSWSLITVVRRNGIGYIYHNGNLITSGSFTENLTGDSTAQLSIGTRFNQAEPWTVGSLALFRISGTVPSAEQIKKMYNDEKHLFATNAKATLYGTSDAVTALAYDDSTELLHVGTSAGRSEFQGLNRVNNTTDAVGTAISASNGFIVEE